MTTDDYHAAKCQFIQAVLKHLRAFDVCPYCGAYRLFQVGYFLILYLQITFQVLVLREGSIPTNKVLGVGSIPTNNHFLPLITSAPHTTFLFSNSNFTLHELMTLGAVEWLVNRRRKKKSSIQKTSTSKWVFLKTWIRYDSTSKRPRKANFGATKFECSTKYAGSDTEISGAKKEETIFRLMPGFCWLHHKWINISNLFVDYNYYNPEMEYSMSFWITRGLHIRSFSSAWVFQTIRKDFQSNFMLPACARENGRRFPSM